jgi:hypothetical protein
MAAAFISKRFENVQLPEDADADDFDITEKEGSTVYKVKQGSSAVIIKIILPNGQPQCHRLEPGQGFTILGGTTITFQPPQPTIGC